MPDRRSFALLSMNLSSGERRLLPRIGSFGTANQEDRLRVGSGSWSACEFRQARYGASEVWGFRRSTVVYSLFRALMYALAEAATMSGSDPVPLTMRPARASRTVTSPCDSVPVVIALTEYSISSEPLFTLLSIALSEASTGPLPSDCASTSSEPTRKTTRACGRLPVSDP